MAESVYIASQNGVVENRIVQALFQKNYRGFLLTRQGPIAESEFFALYTDGVVEQIDPPNGSPRPEPDPAVRSKFLVLPASLQSGVSSNYTTGSLFTGAIRAVVQSDHIRGQETKFNYTWGTSHGLLEYPRPRFVGSDEFDEEARRAERKHYVIEVSSLGVYAAPVRLGANSSSYGLVGEYLPTAAQLAQNPGWQTYKTKLSLWWAYTYGGSGKVQRLLTAEQIAPAYAHGAPWKDSIGWAFDIYGRKAANVVSITRTDGFDFSAIDDYYETRLMELSFDVQEVQQDVSIQLLSPGQAIASSVAHGFSDGQVVVIAGADQPEYNGPHVIFNTSPNTFEFNVTGSPGSPATGDVKVINPANEVQLSAQLAVGAAGKVTFRWNNGGTLWIPQGDIWAAVRPFRNVIAGSGPVHVFYDGEDQILTTWSSNAQSISAFETPPFAAPAPYQTQVVQWDGVNHISHQHNDTDDQIFLCQEGACFRQFARLVSTGSGEKHDAHSNVQHGFSNSLFDLTVSSYSKTARYSQTSNLGKAGEFEDTFPNLHGVCPSCSGIVQCSNTYHVIDTVIATRTRRRSGTEQSDGGSSLMLLPREREAIAGISFERTRFVGSEETTGEFQVRVGRLEENAGGDCPFTNFERDDYYIPGFLGTPFPYPTPNPGTIAVDTRGFSGNFHLRAVGKSLSKSLTFNSQGVIQNPDLFEFSYWTKGQHETAQSALFAMRGGLFHDDPSLDPPAGQVQNLVTSVDGDVVISGGFAELDGKTIIGFVGLV